MCIKGEGGITDLILFAHEPMFEIFDSYYFPKKYCTIEENGR